MLRPGQVVEISGVYTVIHTDHVPPHYVTAVQGDTLPACLECFEEVRFEIVLPCSPVHADPRFSRVTENPGM